VHRSRVCGMCVVDISHRIVKHVSWTSHGIVKRVVNISHGIVKLCREHKSLDCEACVVD